MREIDIADIYLESVRRIRGENKNKKNERSNNNNDDDDDNNNNNNDDDDDNNNNNNNYSEVLLGAIIHRPDAPLASQERKVRIL